MGLKTLFSKLKLKLKLKLKRKARTPTLERAEAAYTAGNLLKQHRNFAHSPNLEKRPLSGDWPDV